MIPVCKSYVEAVLKSIGISAVFTDPDEVSKQKGVKHALLETDQPLQFTRDGARLAKTIDSGTGAHIYHRRIYKTAWRMTVYISAKDEAAANKLTKDFLKNLQEFITDEDGYGVEVNALTGNLTTEKSVMRSSAVYDILMEFTGGVYRADTVPLLPEVAPEGEIVQEV
ncbi:MAG: hypothetical protein P4N59_10780 [Negativicutes bacterium]|nr:hypothetical protein [Negativicutes bacterium]